MQIDLASSGGEIGALSQTLRSQVCVVGGGIAGLLVADRLAKAGVEVTLLEAGGAVRSEFEPSDPFTAELRGQPHAGTREGRVRALGGCSLTWGGQLLPLPEDAAWPVSRVELRPYEAAAGSVFGVDDLPYEAGPFFARGGFRAPALLERDVSLVPRLSKFVPFGRRNLATTLGRQLREHQRVKVALNAPAVELLPVGDEDRVGAVSVGLPSGARVSVEADEFVLAAGTVETCRLLLASRCRAADGVGNANGQVGANFQDHLTLTAARLRGRARELSLRDLGAWVVGSGQGATLHSLKLELPPDLRARLGIRPAMAHVTVEEPAGSGMAVLRELLRARQSGGMTSALRQHAADVPAALAEALRLGWSATALRRRFVSAKATVRLQLNVAQDGGRDCRVALAETADRFGVPHARVDWRVSAADLQSLRGLAGYLLQVMKDGGFDEGADWEPALFSDAAEHQLLSMVDDARHAMGGACMGNDPRSSVVDADLRVHRVRNLSIASAAVFPDGSPQLPTLTLAALSLRLADRLGKGRG